MPKRKLASPRSRNRRCPCRPKSIHQEKDSVARRCQRCETPDLDAVAVGIRPDLLLEGTAPNLLPCAGGRVVDRCPAAEEGEDQTIKGNAVRIALAELKRHSLGGAPRVLLWVVVLGVDLVVPGNHSAPAHAAVVACGERADGGSSRHASMEGS
jgi:hypothetical protein